MGPPLPPQPNGARAWQQFTYNGRLGNGVLWRLHLDAVGTGALTASQAEAVVRCYIDPPKLREMSAQTGHDPAQLFRDLLPTDAKLVSGDFGEMFVWLDVQERPPLPRFPLYRWRLRAKRNDTIRGVDLLGYVLAGPEPTPNDLLVLCEVKTRSQSRNGRAVQRALDGVLRDYATRVASQLLFQHARLLQDGDAAGAAALARFYRTDVVPFRVRLIAAVVEDTRLWRDTDLNYLPQQHTAPAEVEVHITCVDDLWPWIGNVHGAAAAWCET